MPFVSVTRLRVQAWRYLPIFFVQTLRSAWQARSAKNCLSVFVLREAHRTFWTRTVWTDASSMKSFMLSGVHRQVMPSLLVCGATRLPLPIGFRIRWNLRRGRRCIDGCSTMEDVPKSTIRQKRTAASRFLLLFSGRLENCDSSDPMTAANAAAQRSLRVDVRIGSFTNRRTPQ
jgi:hypothetical protein